MLYSHAIGSHPCHLRHAWVFATGDEERFASHVVLDRRVRHDRCGIGDSHHRNSSRPRELATQRLFGQLITIEPENPLRPITATMDDWEPQNCVGETQSY